MVQTFKYRAYPSDEIADEARHHIDLCRQLYNHALGIYQSAPDDDKPSYNELQNKLPQWKRRWSVWRTVHSKCLQMALQRIFHSLSVLDELKNNGHNVGELRWKAPRAYRSIVFNQSGFDVDCNTGRTDHAILRLSKIGKIDLKYHRELPEDGTIKQVILKEEKSGTWHASIVVDHQPSYPQKPPIETIDPTETVGIDLGILKLIHDSNGVSVTPLDESTIYERIERRHRALSRKEHGSNNWERARKKLASAYERLSNKREDFLEKLAHSYTRRYDAVFLEDLDVHGLLTRHSTGRQINSMSWRKLISTFKRQGEKNGCHVLTVPPEGTTKWCARCGSESEKPLWVRNHSCPNCDFETDRDQNAALEIKRLGLSHLVDNQEDGVNLGLGEAEETPVETVLPTETVSVSAQYVVESGNHVPPDT